MPFDAPFQLGPFAVSADGSLALASPERLPRFEITWRGCRVGVLLCTRGADNTLGALSLRAVIGRVPSTARTTGPVVKGRAVTAQATARRTAVLEALRFLPGTLPEGWRTDLLADHRVTLLSASNVETPITAESLLTDVTLFLLALGPYLDLMAGVGMEAPAGAA